MGAANELCLWAGGAVKFFPPGKYWKRTILKYSKNFCILYIEKMKRGNKVESTYKKNEKIRAANLPLQKNSCIIYIESERESNLSNNSKLEPAA